MAHTLKAKPRSQFTGLRGLFASRRRATRIAISLDIQVLGLLALIAVHAFRILLSRIVEGLEIESVKRIGRTQASALPKKPNHHLAVMSRHCLFQERYPALGAALFTNSNRPSKQMTSPWVSISGYCSEKSGHRSFVSARITFPLD